MALGQGDFIIGSLNKSAIHSDMICDIRDGGKIFVDDELFYDSGEFVVWRILFQYRKLDSSYYPHPKVGYF